MSKKSKCWLILLLLQLTWIPLYFFGPGTECEPQEEVVEEKWDLIRWKQDIYEEALEVSVEQVTDIED